MQTFELEDKDCAIILKEDSSVEILVPKYEDENEEVGNNVILAVGIVTLIPKPELQKLITKTMNDVFNEIKKEEQKGD